MTDALRKVSGIYQITNRITGKIYIGSSVDIGRRIYLHKWSLRTKRHHSIHLQRSWDRHGENAFEFRLLQTCPANKLQRVEQEYLDEMKPYKRDIGYNVCNRSDSSRGVVMPPEFGRKISKAKTGKKINRVLPGKTGKDHHFYGRRHSEESKKKMSESRKGTPAWNRGISTPKKLPIYESSKFTANDILYIRSAASSKEKSQKEIAKEFCVDPSTISHIVRGRSYPRVA